MAIVCCSQDDKLIAKLVSLVGNDHLIVRPDTRLVQEDDTQAGEVLIIDLKCTDIPIERTISLPIIALTEIPNFQESLVLLQKGVRGYGNRHMRQENLEQAMKTVTTGQIWLPPEIITQLIASAGTGVAKQQDQSILNALSEREREVANYVAKGMSNQEIADRMFLSLSTIKAHLSSIYGKTGLRNRLELGLRLKKES